MPSDVALPPRALPSRDTPRRLLAGLALGLSLSNPSIAAELTVRISGISEPLGQIGCSLFAQDAGFPMDNRSARVTWLAADTQGVVCRYADVAEGRYAIAVSHDLNGNRRVDTNFVGMPTEPWGVSNNVRPRLRAPRFDEAVFNVPAGATAWTVDIQVAR